MIKKEPETPITESTYAEEKENVGEDKLDGASKSDETATGSSKQDMASENSEEKTGTDVENKDDTMTNAINKWLSSFVARHVFRLTSLITVLMKGL